jgi:hypothetical protein
MKYNKKEIFKEAKKLIEKNKLFFVEDLVSLLPLSKPTFYEYFKVGSNEFNEIKKLLDNQKINLKVSMRSKWYKSDNATLQMGLMKLICTDEERKILSTNYTDVTTKGNEVVSVPITFVDFEEKNKEEK